MNTSYQLIIFDWEGTLGDTLGQVLQTLVDEAARLHLGEVDKEQAREYLALGLERTIKKLFPQMSSLQHENLLQAVQHALMTHPLEVHLFPGAKALLQQIKSTGMQLAIATNKGQQSLQRALHMCGLEDLFTVTRSAGQVPPKPCPQMIEEILEAAAVAPQNALMIGDTVADMEMAKSAGVDAVGVDFYHQQSDNLLEVGALEVFNNYLQLARFLHL